MVFTCTRLSEGSCRISVNPGPDDLITYMLDMQTRQLHKLPDSQVTAECIYIEHGKCMNWTT